MAPGPWPALAVAAALLVKLLVQAVLVRRARSGARQGYVTTSLLFVGYAAAAALATWRLWSVGTPVPFVGSGAVLFLAGFTLRTLALLRLGPWFSSFIELRPDQPLVRDGAYAVVRHPLHVGFWLEAAGLGLASGSAWATAPLALLAAVILLRNREEEAALARQFGRAWEEYAREVPALDVVTGGWRAWRRIGS